MVPVGGVAVPAVALELVLTLLDPVADAAADRCHRRGVLSAELPLSAHQTRNVITHHLRAQRTHEPGQKAGSQVK